MSSRHLKTINLRQMKLQKSISREAKRFHNYLKLLIFLRDDKRKYKVSKEYKRNEIIVIGGE